MFSAAWAPIASDSTPAAATTTAMERREIRSEPICITVIPVFVTGGAGSGRADAIQGLGGARWGCPRIAINLRHRTKRPLTYPAHCGNTGLSPKGCRIGLGPARELRKVNSFSPFARFHVTNVTFLFLNIRIVFQGLGYRGVGPRSTLGLARHMARNQRKL